MGNSTSVPLTCLNRRHNIVDVLSSSDDRSDLDFTLSDLAEEDGPPGRMGCCRGKPVSERMKKKERVKMVLLLSIPFAMLLGICTYFLTDSVDERSKMNEARDVIVYSVELGQVFHSLQRERDQSVLYLSAIGPQTKSFLLKQYLETDNQLEKLSAWPDSLSNTLFQTKAAFHKYLDAHRKALDTLNNTIFEEIEFYTDSIETFLQWLYDSVSQSRHTPLWKALVAYQKVIRAKEDMGEERALGTYYYSHGGFPSIDKYVWYTKQVFNFRHAYGQARRYSNLVESINKYEVTVDGRNLTDIIDVYRSDILWGNMTTEVSVVKATLWFDYVSLYFEQLLSIQLDLADALIDKIDEQLTMSNTLFGLSTMIECLVVVLVPILLRVIYSLTADIQLFAFDLSEQTNKLKEEKQKTDDIFHQMLPKIVADKLKLNQVVVAEYFNNVTIGFSDMHGFVDLMKIIGPREVVDLVNQIFQAFDDRIELHDVYKVETIGHSYMVASGLPMRNGNSHAKQIANMSLELMEAYSKLQLKIEALSTVNLRIGAHTGPVMAGIIGKTFPRYCLFGDTVITASRMNTLGLPNGIQISSQTQQLLTKEGGYDMRKRGAMRVKGKGMMTTYWVLGRSESILPNVHPDDMVQPICLGAGSGSDLEALDAEDIIGDELVVDFEDDPEVGCSHFGGQHRDSMISASLHSVDSEGRSLVNQEHQTECVSEAVEVEVTRSYEKADISRGLNSPSIGVDVSGQRRNSRLDIEYGPDGERLQTTQELVEAIERGEQCNSPPIFQLVEGYHF